jgi:hypothetical protein
VPAKKGARPSRAKKRERLLEACAATTLPASCDVLVAGAGASGLAAAVELARAGRSVVVAERSLEPGLPILATGNGRCNIANRVLDPAVYNRPDFVRAVFGSDDATPDVRAFFASCGLQMAEEDGRLYPVSRSAASVRDVLVSAAEAAGATIACGRTVTDLVQTPRGWSAELATAFGDVPETIDATRVVAASGGGSDLARTLGLPYVETSPVLCALSCRMGEFSRLSGTRWRCAARLVRAGREIWRERGEVLVREAGLSGIVVFNASRFAKPGDTLVLDLLDGCDLPALDAWLARAPGSAASLAGVLDPDTAALLFERSGRDASSAARRARALEFEVTGLLDPAHAQVTRGGVATSAVDPATLEALPGLHVTGEALDVDGPCGGYNLGFAWASGLAAARAIVSKG